MIVDPALAASICFSLLRWRVSSNLGWCVVPIRDTGKAYVIEKFGAGTGAGSQATVVTLTWSFVIGKALSGTGLESWWVCDGFTAPPVSATTTVWYGTSPCFSTGLSWRSGPAHYAEVPRLTRTPAEDLGRIVGAATIQAAWRGFAERAGFRSYRRGVRRGLGKREVTGRMRVFR